MDKEKERAAKGRPNLKAKKDLLLQQYDAFLTAQTRIFTLSRYIYGHPANEIGKRQETLFLDDILSFSISAGRLIELTALKSFSNNKAKVALQRFDRSEGFVKFGPSSVANIGFLALVNKVIHSLFLHRLDDLLMEQQDVVARYELLTRTAAEDRWHKYAIRPVLMVRSDSENELYVVALKDLVGASALVMEKVIEVCSDFRIWLETDLR